MFESWLLIRECKIVRVDVLQLFGDLEGIEEVGDNLERAFEDREHHELLNEEKKGRESVNDLGYNVNEK